MKKEFFLSALILILVGMSIFQHVTAQNETDDYYQNLSLLNEMGDSYVVTKCGKLGTLKLTEVPQLVCTKNIVPGTQNSIICSVVFYVVPNQDIPCCAKMNQ